jgi:hypothetical protein
MKMTFDNCEIHSFLSNTMEFITAGIRKLTGIKKVNMLLGKRFKKQ